MKLVLRAFPVGLCLALCSAVLLGTQARAEVLRDDFNDNNIEHVLWTAHVYGTGPQIAEVDQELEIAIPGWSYGGDFGAKLTSNFLLHGDFDIQVDFILLTWPLGNGVRTALGIDWGFLYPPGVERISFGQGDYEGYPRESYLTDLDGNVCGVTGTADGTGTLRLVRTGNTQAGYYRSGGWVAICTGPAPTADVAVQISAFTAYQFMGWDVSAAWDNFVVNSGDLVWPGVPTGACCLPSGDCVQEIAWECERTGGFYKGDGVPCEPDPCGSTPVKNTTCGEVKSLFR